jgi:hypothetical protein
MGRPDHGVRVGEIVAVPPGPVPWREMTVAGITLRVYRRDGRIAVEGTVAGGGELSIPLAALGLTTVEDPNGPTRSPRTPAPNSGPITNVSASARRSGGQHDAGSRKRTARTVTPNGHETRRSRRGRWRWSLLVTRG